MKWLFITTCITISLLFGCTKKELPAAKTDEAVVQTVTTVSAPIASQTLESEMAQAKILSAHLKFISSLEKEVLKLILESSAPEVNQFEVLGYGFDKFNGAKTGFLAGFGCQKIAVKAGVKKFEIYSECTKPAKKLAEINEDLGNKDKLTVVFLTSNWKVILGNSAGINPDRVCQFLLKENKVQTFECKDTVFSPRITGLDINLYELKIRKYSFNRNQADELVIEGGQYKDMIENKKINLTVPMTGKISIIEKELKVKDDFTDMQNKLLGLEEKKEEVKNGAKEESSKENEKAHTAEPEYIAAGEETHNREVASGTAQNENQTDQGQSEEENQQPEPEPATALPGEAEPNSVPAKPAPYGR